MKPFRKLILVLSVLVLAGCLIFSYIIRFSNPQLTETQLFLKMWWLMIPLFLSGGGIILSKWNN